MSRLQGGASWRYPMIELACALGTLLIVWRYGLTLEALAMAGLWWGIVALTVTDLEHYIILDEVQIVLGLCGLLHAYAGAVPMADVALLRAHRIADRART
ncbi:MAG: hypothetical protein WDN72_08270 [Alphaproteobacteria bacterium]